MILTDGQIMKACQQRDIVIEPYAEAQVQPATYDLRVGQQGATTSTKKVINIKEAGYLLLQPGDFAILMTLEEITLGAQYAARFGLRSKYARKGLIATTGPQIDPGFSGRLVVGMTNLTPTPISLPFKDDFLSVEFHKLEEPAKNPYTGPYQKKTALGPEEIEAVTEGTGMALSEMLTTLRTLTQNVAALTGEVHTLRWAVPIVVTIGIAVIGIIVGLD